MKRSLALILAVLMLLSLCACGQTAAPAQTEAPAPVEEPVQAEEPVATEEPAPAEPEEITITDMIGREVSVTPGSYQRVVCIGAGALRMYSYIGDVSLLCGVEDIDNTSLAERPKMFDSVARPYMLAYGESFTALPSCGVGGPQAQTAEAEKILSCNPDIVISEYEDVEKEDALQEQLGVPVITLKAGPGGVFDDNFFGTMRMLGVLFQNEEVRVFLSYISIAVVIFMLLFYFAPVPQSAEDLLPKGFEETFRSALFHVSSVATSTGFSAQKFDYVAWGASFWMPTVVIMAIGSCAGSTAGGIKVIRIIICAKSAFNELIQMLHPRAVLGVRVNKQIVPDHKVRQALIFVVIYFLLVVIAMTCYSLLGADVDTALGSSISMLSNVGPATGATGPASTFANVPALGKWLMSAYMLIGRLEIFTVLFLLMPNYWKDRK